MEKCELYHIHRKNNYDRTWRVNNEIPVSENFNSEMFKRISKYAANIKVENQEINLYLMIGQLFRLYESEIAAATVNPTYLSKEVLQQMVVLLKDSYKVAYDSNEFKRELAMEKQRLQSAIKLPSRLHCVYLTDEKGLLDWSRKLTSGEYTIYRVEAEGTIFKTNEQLIPDESLSYEDVYKASYKYWHPKEKDMNDNSSSNEYLVQGKIKVLEKIPRI